MPVESVGDVHLEYQGVSLRDGGAFDNSKILAEVVVAADVAKPYGRISKDITSLRHEAGSIRIKEGGAIEIVVGAHAGEKSRLRIFNAAAGALRRVKGRFVGAVNRRARYATEQEVPATGLWGWHAEEYGSWRAALVTLHSTNLPATQDLTGHAMAHIFLSWAGGEFVEIAQHQGVRDILGAYGLF